MRVGLRSVVVFLIVAAVMLAPSSGTARHRRDPAVVGNWSEPTDFPIEGIHAVLLATGKVLFFSHPGHANDEGVPPVVWSPETGDVVEVPHDRHMFCSGHSVLPDGRVLVTGGTEPEPEFEEFEGLPDANIFDPFSETWTQIADMSVGRWYPTNRSLGDGRVLVLTGFDENGELTPVVELFTPDGGGGGTWSVLAGAERYIDLYPFVHLLPSGDVFLSGPERETWLLDVETASWTFVAETNRARWDGTTVLLPPDQMRVLNHGRAGGRKRAEIIDFASPNPQWRYVGSRSRAGNRHVNATILPDGTVLFSGGGKRTALFNPETETFASMDKLKIARRYHSTALLLPDGRVVTAGGDGKYAIEVFSPPYLFRGARPSLSGAPVQVTYGETFVVSTDDANAIETAVFIRPSAVTHSVNMEQRYVALAFTPAGPDTLEVTAPASGTQAPPGYYLLFLVDNDGVPSQAAFVQLI